MELPDPPLVDRSAGVALRAWRTADAPALAEAWATPDIAGHATVPGGGGVEAAERWIGGGPARTAAGLALDLVIGPVDGGTEVWGEVGVIQLRLVSAGPDASSRRRTVWDMGWWLRPEHRGRGRARAGAALLASWVARSLDEPLIARVDIASPASAAVAVGAGLIRRGRYDADHDLWLAFHVGDGDESPRRS